MNKIVHEHLKASELPEKLRGSIPVTATVTVVVEEEVRSAASSSALRQMLEVAALRASPDLTMNDAVARVRGLRDEWDD